MTNTHNLGTNLLLALSFSSGVASQSSYDSKQLQIPTVHTTYSQVNLNYSWETPFEYKNLETYELFSVIENFADGILSNSKDLDEEFLKVVNDSFWDLI